MSQPEAPQAAANMDAHELMDALLARILARDRAGAVALFAEDAVLFDPHYPVPRMAGRAAIDRGLQWGFAGIPEFGFDVRRRWSDDDGDGGGVEVMTRHIPKGGPPIEVEQVFLFEARGGKITRLRAFLPYRPAGIGRWVAQVTGLWWRVRGRR